ncbi:putative amidophosphoribosyltransferase [Shewanella psychrophila]|uniref:Putative amidophosphoribosyltransferase n=1 Tax=Shewanella psychrophila TaxID=225848 RepID=A0A1S6HIV6_9GAMM|nr:double zinc ribbon domain-containing protein [Shewanella psychrophila]AQS35460.1 putative amidophosphoribosyltransferase [Shewanella psychrophila]
MKIAKLTRLKHYGEKNLQRGVVCVKQWLAASLPNRCLMCHQSVIPPGSGICFTCLHSGLYQQPVCLGCGRSLQFQSRYCGACLSSEPLLVISPCSYHQGLGPWVGLIKYRAQFAGLDALSTALIMRINKLEMAGLIERPQVLVPVPLHEKRLKARGFNQAWIIADVLSKRLNIPIETHGLVRSLDTQSQAGLTGKQRRKNLKNAFHLHDDFPYQRIALIDDVVTTGTTAKEIASLFERRHIHVQVWCLARAEAPGLLD